MKLFVAKLNRDAVESDLLEWFGAMGPVRSAKVVTDRETGQSKCFGFVEMESRDAGEKAISEMNGQEYMGFRMVVKEAEERGSRPRPSGGSAASRDGASKAPSSQGADRGGNRSFQSGGPSFNTDKKPNKSKKPQRQKPDKYSDGPKKTKMKKSRGGGGSKEWSDYDDDY